MVLGEAGGEARRPTTWFRGPLRPEGCSWGEEEAGSCRGDIHAREHDRANARSVRRFGRLSLLQMAGLKGFGGEKDQGRWRWGNWSRVWEIAIWCSRIIAVRGARLSGSGRGYFVSVRVFVPRGGGVDELMTVGGCGDAVSKMDGGVDRPGRVGG